MRFVFHIVGIIGGLFVGVSLIAFALALLEDSKEMSVFGVPCFGVFCGLLLISVAHLGEVAIEIRESLNRRDPPSLPPRES